MALKTVTLFGGSGFIGRHLVKRLAKTGARVLIVSRDSERAKFLKPNGDVGQIVPVAADLRNEAELARVLTGSDAVVNLIGILYEKGAQTYQALQADLPGRIGKAAAAAGVERVVQISAIGANPDDVLPYPRSKGQGEAALKAAFPNATILRPSVVFGPEDGFFNVFASISRFAPLLPLYGCGVSKFQPVYVGDVCDAIMAALTRDDVAGKTFELGGPRVISFKEAMELTLKHCWRKLPLVPVPYVVADIQGTIFGLMPKPLMTAEHAKLLRRDNVASGALPGLAELGVTATDVDSILPTYLDRYRPRGRFTKPEAA